MSKGHFVKQNEKKVPFWLILVVLVILAVAAVIFFLRDAEDTVESTQGTEAIQNPTEIQTQEMTVEPTEGTEATQNPTETEATQNPTETEETQNPTATQTSQLVETQPTVVVVQRTDAEYEKWLSAALVVCVSMEYPDFELEGVYAASATALADKFTSEGAYIVFTSGGQRMAIHAKALEGERSAAGTIDISTETIGYATFDKVDPASIDFSSIDQIALDDLSELITQSLLVSIYKR